MPRLGIIMAFTKFLTILLLFTLEIGCFKVSATLSPYIQHYETLDYNLEAVHLQHKRVARSVSGRDGIIDLKFSAHKRDFHLRLKRDSSLFTSDFQLVSTNGEETPDVNFFYNGDVADTPGSYCHGSISDEGLFQGKIHVDDDVYSVEPISNYETPTPARNSTHDHHSIIYAAKDVDYTALGGGCGLMKTIQQRMEATMKEAENEEKKNGKGDGASYFGRHKRQASSEQTCTLFIRTDRDFYGRFGSRTAVLRQIGEHVQAATNIYSKTDFGDYKDINFAVAKVEIFTPDSPDSSYPFLDNNLGVEKYLDIASIGDLDAYCLAYTFSNRDFANGVLGLAWIGTDAPGSTGGLCSRQLTSRGATLNTGILTINNYGSYVPPLMSHLTFAHEIGHSFGSNHDDMSNQVCSPGGAGGQYIMFARATSGAFANNDDFSSCSYNMITNVLTSVFNGRSKTNCFVDRSSVTLCGNEVIEEGEDCDCGYDDQCQDTCCIPQSSNGAINVNACNLISTAQCSPQQGSCCNANTCQFEPQGTFCQEESECASEAKCTGGGVNCGTPTPKPDKEKCDNDRKLCRAGECIDSICMDNNLEECECTEQVDLCQICCQNIGQSGSCVPGSRIGIVGAGNSVLYLDPGTPCNENMGYCDQLNYCRLANEDGPLAAIIRRVFFNDGEQLTDVIWLWIRQMWWVIVIIIVALIVLMILVVFICERLIPTTNPWKHDEAMSRQRASVNVKLQKKRNRGSKYYGQPPDNGENTATRF